MKKIVVLSLICILLVGCGRKDVDPFAAYRNKTSTELFTGGEKALYKENYAEAVKYFEALDAIYPFGPYSQQGQLDVIYAYHKSGDDASAVAAADRYIRLYPQGEHTDYAYYMRGVVGFLQGLSWLQKLAGVDPAPRDVSTLQQSYASFAALTKEFPSSPYTPDSRLRMAYIRNLMARREILIANFYYGRRAYVAAANRAAYVVQHYERSPYVIQALALMVKSYRALDLQQMADSTYQILQASYPNSPEFRELKRT